MILTQDFVGTPIWLWAIFAIIVVAVLVLDLGLFNRRDHEIGVRESLILSGFYISLALLFGLLVLWVEGGAKATDFYTAYIVEESLSLDNIFVIALIFGYFRIPRMYQHRVLFWGIVGVLVLRGIMIFVGAGLVERYGWILYLFAAFLVFTGIRMLATGHDAAEAQDLAHNPVVRLARRHLSVTDEFHGHAFTVVKDGKRWVTPLFLALITVETADVIFAVDSIPAVFAITTDTFIVYSSNIFAILGLRALFFALSAVLDRFRYLSVALAVLLIFIGGKVFATHLLGWEKFPPTWSLGITFAILAAGVIVSLVRTRREREAGT